MEALAASEPRLALVRRVITRAPEAGGEDYVPVTEAEFAAMEARGDFILSWPAHGLLYGIPKGVLDRLNAGQDLLINLSRSVLAEAAAKVPRFLVVSLTARPDVLAARLSSRSRESAEDIARRLARVAKPLPDGLDRLDVDNSAELEQTLRTLRGHLYPEFVDP